MEIYCIQCKINVGIDTLSRLPNNGNEKTTHDSDYIMKNMLEINYTEKQYEGTFLMTFKKSTNIHGDTPAYFPN